MLLNDIRTPIHTNAIRDTLPGYGLPDGTCLPSLGVSGRTMGMSPKSSSGGYRLSTSVKLSSFRCASNHLSSVCHASSNSYRRNPDFSRQNKQGYSRNRNRNEERDVFEDHEESESLSSRNGPLLSLSGNQKVQATATPGPREKEIVELFRKVQAQLRERAAKKEEKKVDDSLVKSKESENVDSLLKLLRKHSVQQRKKNTVTSNDRDFSLDNNKQAGPPVEELGTIKPNSNSSAKHEIHQNQGLHPGRPKSNFQKRSPVPETKFKPVYSKSSTSSITEDTLHSRIEKISLETEADDILEVDVDPLFSEGNGFDEILEDETSEIYESEQYDVEQPKVVEASDLSGMKLTELRALAKSRGIKGFSKLKKSELIQLLSE